VWWVNNLSYGDGFNSKGRPVVVVAVSGDAVTYRKCTSQTCYGRERYRIIDLMSAGLEKETYVDMETLTMKRDRLHHKMGRLSEHDADLGK